MCDMSTEHLVSNNERRKSCTTGGLEVLKGGNRSRPPQWILGLQIWRFRPCRHPPQRNKRCPMPYKVRSGLAYSRQHFLRIPRILDSAASSFRCSNHVISIKMCAPRYAKWAMVRGSRKMPKNESSRGTERSRERGREE